ncbi:hypothetical protein [Candidatus Uabimicrobium amorphum]|uniref:Disulfide reductase n=1 Tax=Uabimicrobium amorphum TaxID=2596890 RepID=A0A5S9IR39_UABAM|nr:hypothetical protein [Candidatus Uabimicrobium amorphum]BBM86086.1 hypothetical protein UABAM_04472 [Candidatus Uabimicrobium amorphum]
MSEKPKILYCHCAYSRAVPKEVKMEVLRKLSDSGVNFEAVPDICKLSAEKSPVLKDFAQQEDLHIIACYPRAVKWLFKSAQAPLQQQKIANMRAQQAQEIIDQVMEK